MWLHQLKVSVHDLDNDPDLSPYPGHDLKPRPFLTLTLKNQIMYSGKFSFGCKQKSKQYRSEGRAEGHWLLLLLLHSQVDLSRTSRGLQVGEGPGLGALGEHVGPLSVFVWDKT